MTTRLWYSLILVMIDLASLEHWAEGQSPSQNEAVLKATLTADMQGITVHRRGSDQPVVTQQARPDSRPCLHPLVAPDGQGQLTEFRPDHHPHQTGLFWGFTRLNGRDYFHHPEDGYWKRISLSVLQSTAATPQDFVQWQTVYDLLDEAGQSVLRESMIWTMRDAGSRYFLDLQWTGQALVDIQVGQADYGGLFLRMPWRPGIDGEVVNHARQVGSRAEGQRAIWLDAGIRVDGREDRAHVAIFDHPLNSGFPQPWRVDQQLGVGPVRSRLGNWRIVKGQQETVRHRLVVYTGELKNQQLTDDWFDYTGQGGDWAQWSLAQQEGRKAEFLTAEQAVAKMTLPDGFQANVFASEPMISQPMAFCWDARGRLWIAENRDYETRQSGFSGDGTSRILILEDTDKDGDADSSKVFLDGIPFPAAIAVGMGGLWLGAPPNLLFVPDRNGDDRADADDIEVRLTGWGIRDRHETLNSFLWGPDGWLYGLQGYATPSTVGKPASKSTGKGHIYRHQDAFPSEIEFADVPTKIDGGVWRYHPTKDRFEVVAHGFSNPWGIDYDAQGQLFITACVIPHLWHVIPGGIYHRQGGQHINQHVYDDIKTITDHRHQSAHGGARVYQSDAFPKHYHGRLFMANIHEHAVLTDVLEPSRSGFIGRHGDDFMLANNAQWVGFSIEVGPDGAVYALDWHDADICGKEVLNKPTGRVYRLAPTESAATSFAHRDADLNQLDDLSLANLQTVPSAWHANQARVILQHRATTRQIDALALDRLRKLMQPNLPVPVRLRAVWALHVCQSLNEEELLQLLQDRQPYVRAWSIQLSCEDFAPSAKSWDQMLAMAVDDPSPVVRLYLASAVQRVKPHQQWELLERLSRREEDQLDQNIPRLLWFGLEPLVTKDHGRALDLAVQSRLTHLTRSVARRLGDAEEFDLVLERAASEPTAMELGNAQPGGARLPLLLGLRDAVEGHYDMKAPQSWKRVFPKLTEVEGPVAEAARQLSAQFGDAVAAEQMLVTLRDGTVSSEQRRQALQNLAGRKRLELKRELPKLLDQSEMRQEAIRAVTAFDDVRFAKELLNRYPDFSEAEKLDAIHALASRSSYGNELTAAIKSGAVPKRDVPAHVARLLRRVVGNRFVDVWGPIDELDVNKEGLFSKYRELLTESALRQANLANGRGVFQKSCASCHTLHGEGGKIGPDITGANRSNLEYLLSNILTPSAIIQDAYRMHIILTDDGRVLSGIPAEDNERTLKLLVADRPEPLVVPKATIESREIAAVSMMPDALLANLRDAEVIDLVAYLQSPQQVPLSHATPRIDVRSWKELQQWVAQQRGNVVVLDLWSTWCETCLKEFPHFVALHQQKLPQVVCASVNLDFTGGKVGIADEERQPVIEFLQQQGGPLQNFMISDGDEAVFRAIKVASIPVALVYDREGNLHKVFKNDDLEFGNKGFTYEKDILPVVKKLSE